MKRKQRRKLLAVIQADQLERTCRGEMEQARTWNGSECYCGKCGAVIPRFVDNHQCERAQHETQARIKQQTPR